MLGKATFKRLLNDPRFKDIPMILETPCPGEGLSTYQKEIALLNSLID